MFTAKGGIGRGTMLAPREVTVVVNSALYSISGAKRCENGRMLWALSTGHPDAALSACAELAGLPDPVASLLPVPKGEGIDTEARLKGAMRKWLQCMNMQTLFS